MAAGGSKVAGILWFCDVMAQTWLFFWYLSVYSWRYAWRPLLNRVKNIFHVQTKCFQVPNQFSHSLISLNLQIGSLFTRHNWPEAGAGPAVGGIMGLALVEHVILWRTIKNPRSRLTLLVICLCVLFLIGTLPQVNNYSLITGLFYGCLCALVLWSPIVFQGKLTRCKFVFVFVIVTMLLFSLALFYGVQQIDLNSFDYVNCMPYADGLCN